MKEYKDACRGLRYMGVAALLAAIVMGAAVALAISTGTTSAGAHTVGNPNESCWQVVSSPNQGAGDNFLQGVAAVSASDVWAVGYYVNDVVTQTLVLHWDGTSWSIVSSPNPGDDNYLLGVAVVSASDVWAVGYYTDQDASRRYSTLVERWDGNTWRVVDSPNPGAFSNRLNGVAAVSATDVWAVGYATDSWWGGGLPLTMHWDGNTWCVVGGVNTVLNGVTAVSPDDVWAVGVIGSYNPGSSSPRTVHWNGTAWTLVWSPTDNGGLVGAAEVSANDVWAVGYAGPFLYRTLVAHWNGSTWSVIATPDPGGYNNKLNGVAAVSTNDVWAVGSYVDSSTGADRTLVERFTPCGTITPVPPTPTHTPTATTEPTMTPVASTTPVATATSTSTLTPISVPPHTATPTGVPTGTPVACAITFSDVNRSDYFYQAVNYLWCHGIISGYADNTFRPYNNATRSQLTKIVVLAEGWPIATPAGTPTFSDVPDNNPFYQYVETAVTHGVISGYSDGTFRPYNDVTRGQLCKIVVLGEAWAMNTSGGPHFMDVAQGSTFYDYVETAYNAGIISGYSDSTFRPGNNATRGQISKIVYNAITGP